MKQPIRYLLVIILLIILLFLAFQKLPIEKVISEETIIRKILTNKTSTDFLFTKEFTTISSRTKIVSRNWLVSNSNDTIVIIDTSYLIDSFTWEDQMEFVNEYQANTNSVLSIRDADNMYHNSKYSKYSYDQIDSLPDIIIPIKFHDVLKSDSENSKKRGKTVDDLADYDIVLDSLNSRFRKASIQFVNCGNINYIYDPKLYNFPKLGKNEDGSDNFDYVDAVMNKYNYPNVLNMYLVNDMSGIAGMYPGDGPKNPESALFIKKDKFTWGIPEHEVGHWLYLRHTHDHEMNDTITQELVNANNCDVAGDKICDTPADPDLSHPIIPLEKKIYSVNKSCVYIGNLRDINNQVYQPDVKNIMSYTIPNCQCNFSNEQLKRMAILVREARSFLSQAECKTDSKNPIVILEDSTITKYADIVVDQMELLDEKGNKKLVVSLTNKGEVASQKGENIQLSYYVNNKKENVLYDFGEIKVGETKQRKIPIYPSKKDTEISIKVEVVKISNEQQDSNNKMDSTFLLNDYKDQLDTVKVDLIVLNNVSTDCASATRLKLRQWYQVNLDNTNNAIDNGFWFSFFVPKDDLVYKIIINDVSNTFDPIVGVKSNCSYANFIPDDYNERADNLLNFEGIGVGETFYSDFYGVSKGNNGLYHLTIRNYQNSQSSKISFKIIIQ